MVRFPLLFASLTIFTAIAMAQYHRVSLPELSYQEELSREAEKQTKAANERAVSEFRGTRFSRFFSEASPGMGISSFQILRPV